MRQFCFSLRAATIAGVAGALIGCASGQPVQPASGSAQSSPAGLGSYRPSSTQSYPTSGTLLFEGNTAPNQIEIFRAGRLKRKAPIATITDAIYCPMGMVLDKRGTLYVADSCGYTPDVTEYPKGQTTHSVAIADGITYPEGLAIDANETLYVSTGNATIQEYAYGTTSPSQTITGGGLSDPYGLAVDANQDLFIADSGAHEVFEVPYGTTNVENLYLQGLNTPFAVAFDKSGNLWETDNGPYDDGIAYVNIYPPGSTTPSTTITGLSYPYGISIDKQGTAAITYLKSPMSAIYLYKPGQYTPYAKLKKDISTPTSVLLGKP
jgi:serine/threonine protein kinase, bacterial